MTELPFAHQWTIAENQLLPLKDYVDGGLFSARVSNIPEFDYYLAIFPNGDVEERRGKTGIYLHLEFKNIKKVEADYTFTIESANFSKARHYIFKESFGWGPSVCKTEEFFNPKKKYIVNGKFTVKVDGIFKYETAIPAAVGDGQQKWIGGELGDEFWAKNDTKDFTVITSDGNENKVHKSVLDVRSEVFTAMLKSNMKETTENKVTITDFSTSLSLEELMSLLQFFDKYLLKALKAKVEPYLIAKISPSTVVSLTNASIQTNSFKLKEKCMEFLSTAFASKTPLADIDDLDKDILLEIIKNSLFGTLETETQ